MNNLVCLCGSTRFLDDFNEANIELTKRGMSVLTISMCLPKNEQGSEEESSLKELLDLVHLHKIMRSDAVLVVGDGYFGRSTAREILWARMLGKPVFFKGEINTWDQTVKTLQKGVQIADVTSLARRKLGLI